MIDMGEALERCATLVKAACDLIEKNHLQEYTAIWDEAECDGYCYLDDAKVALDMANEALESTWEEQK